MPVGQIKLDYLLINALEDTASHSMEFSYANHWKKRKTLEVGHRGCGNSYTKFSGVRENTIHSLSEAARLGADFVEFDAQLSKEKIAIVFHDFHVLVSVAKRSPSLLDLSTTNSTNGHNTSRPATPENKNRLLVANTELSQIIDYHQLAVCDLRLEQLRLLQVHHHKALDNQDKLQVSGAPDESSEFLPFPKLVDVLQQVNTDTGFNIEIKYPQSMEDGSHECKNFFERNEYIDVILGDVLKHGGKRRIVFSSFDPDICTLISAKQNKYPVLFLSVGVTSRYVPYYKDVRTQSSQMAVNFAMCFHILGCNFHSEDLLCDPTPVKSARQFGLISFVWGDDLEKQEIIDYFRKEILVDGIIYDRIGEIESRQNVFVVEREVRNALFKHGLSPSPSRTNSVDKFALGTLNGVGSAPHIVELIP